MDMSGASARPRALDYATHNNLDESNRARADHEYAPMAHNREPIARADTLSPECVGSSVYPDSEYRDDSPTSDISSCSRLVTEGSSFGNIRLIYRFSDDGTDPIKTQKNQHDEPRIAQVNYKHAHSGTIKMMKNLTEIMQFMFRALLKVEHLRLLDTQRISRLMKELSILNGDLDSFDTVVEEMINLTRPGYRSVPLSHQKPHQEVIGTTSPLGAKRLSSLDLTENSGPHIYGKRTLVDRSRNRKGSPRPRWCGTSQYGRVFRSPLFVQSSEPQRRKRGPPYSRDIWLEGSFGEDSTKRRRTCSESYDQPDPLLDMQYREELLRKFDQTCISSLVDSGTSEYGSSDAVGVVVVA